MFRKLKDRATAVAAIAALLTRAEQIANGRGAEQPAAEDLVLAALELPDGTAARALERIGSSATDLRAALDAQEADDLARVGIHADPERIAADLPAPTEPRGTYRSEASARSLFQAAGDDARRAGGSLCGAHVLQAATELERGPIARALRRMGIDRTELRAACAAEIEAHRA